MADDPRRGFKLIDLMVAIFVIAILLGFFIPATNTRCVVGRRTQCQNNMRQLGLALLHLSVSKGYFPNAGTIFDDPAVHQDDPAKSNIYLSMSDPAALPKDPNPLLYNWVVEILPYLDQQDLANAIDPAKPYFSTTARKSGDPSNATVTSTALGVLRCPDDTTAQPGQGNLSYVVNGGFVRWPAIPLGWEGGATDGQPRNGERLEWVPRAKPWTDSPNVARKLGVMFLGTQTGSQPRDIKTGPNDIPDGASGTLLVAENTFAGVSPATIYSGNLPTNWACPLPNFSLFLASDDVCKTDRSPTDCLGSQLRPRSSRSDGPGWAMANRQGTFENINGNSQLSVEGSFPFANSGHDRGANFVFCDGATRFVSGSIDGSVYAKLITPAGGQLPPAIRQNPAILRVDGD